MNILIVYALFRISAESIDISSIADSNWLMASPVRRGDVGQVVPLVRGRGGGVVSTSGARPRRSDWHTLPLQEGANGIRPEHPGFLTGIASKSSWTSHANFLKIVFHSQRMSPGREFTMC